jgi:D-alanine transaminase
VDAEGRVTEGASSTAWIVDDAGRLRTRPLGPEILPGVTRATVARLAREAGLEVEEAAFTPEEVFAAREAFGTSASGFVLPVVRADGRQLGDGRPGPVTLSLRSLYLNAIRNACERRVFPHESPGS